MTTIDFQRVERDCPHNKRLREGSPTHGFIYDFNVVINGEHRATFKKIYSSGNYSLLDASGNSIKESDSHCYPVLARNQREFLPLITKLLEAGRIPTLQQMAEAKAEAERKKAQMAAIKAEHERIRRIEAAGPDLYEALKELRRIVDDARADEDVDAMTEAGGYICGDVMSEALEAAARAIAKAEEIPS